MPVVPDLGGDRRGHPGRCSKRCGERSRRLPSRPSRGRAGRNEHRRPARRHVRSRSTAAISTWPGRPGTRSASTRSGWCPRATPPHRPAARGVGRASVRDGRAGRSRDDRHCGVATSRWTPTGPVVHGRHARPPRRAAARRSAVRLSSSPAPTRFADIATWKALSGTCSTGATSSWSRGRARRRRRCGSALPALGRADARRAVHASTDTPSIFLVDAPHGRRVVHRRSAALPAAARRIDGPGAAERSRTTSARHGLYRMAAGHGDIAEESQQDTAEAPAANGRRRLATARRRHARHRRRARQEGARRRRARPAEGARRSPTSSSSAPAPTRGRCRPSPTPSRPRCGKTGRKPALVEGESRGEWVLIDYFDFIVHVFTPATREFYGLERLWGDAERIEVSASRSSRADCRFCDLSVGHRDDSPHRLAAGGACT